jgi:prepilin-type N-terminal cleavage/methylation domain-containing protein
MVEAITSLIGSRATDVQIKSEPSMNIRGFTLVELLVVAVIAGILASIALPNFGPLRDKENVRAVATQFAKDVEQQRSLARTENRRRIIKVLSADATAYLAGPCADNSCTAISPDMVTASTGNNVKVLSVSGVYPIVLSFSPPYGIADNDNDAGTTFSLQKFVFFMEKSKTSNSLAQNTACPIRGIIEPCRAVHIVGNLGKVIAK